MATCWKCGKPAEGSRPPHMCAMCQILESSPPPPRDLTAPPPKSRTLLYAIIGLVVAGGVVGAVLYARQRSSEHEALDYPITADGGQAKILAAEAEQWRKGRSALIESLRNFEAPASLDGLSPCPLALEVPRTASYERASANEKLQSAGHRVADETIVLGHEDGDDLPARVDRQLAMLLRAADRKRFRSVRDRYLTMAALELPLIVLVLEVNEKPKVTTFDQTIAGAHIGRGKGFVPGRRKGTAYIFDKQTGKLRCAAPFEATSSESVETIQGEWGSGTEEDAIQIDFENQTINAIVAAVSPARGSSTPPAPVELLALGGMAAAVRLGDGTAWLWGMIGEPGNERTPIPVRMQPLDNAIALTGGSMTTLFCGVFKDGTGTCVERSWNKETGAFSWAVSKMKGYEPATDALRNIRALAPSFVFDCAVLSNGTVRCWGELGGSEHHEPIAIKGVTTAVDVVVDGSYACALLRDRRVACWRGEKPSATIVKGIDRVTQLAAGDSACALRDDETVWCWRDDAPPARVANVSDVVELRAGANNVCTRHRDGTVMCWGKEMTSSAVASEQAPHAVGVTDAKLLGVGDLNACVVRATGAVSCWGDPLYGINPNTNHDITDVRWESR